MMKDLIAIFTYCPDTERKLILIELLQKLQKVRDKNDIIVVSHSELPLLTNELSDYQYIESDNHLLYDSEYTNKFWFDTNIIYAHSSLVYPFSTHFSIYSLIHYVINFSTFKNYKKIHCIEYDIEIENIDLIENVSKKLDEFNNVMFKSDDDWVHGTYFAFNTNNFPENYFKYDENFILSELKTVNTRMTEHYTPKFLSINGRTTYFYTTKSINSSGWLQKKDSHGNQELNWCVPILEKETETVHFLVFNEKGGEYNLDVIYDDRHVNVKVKEKGEWKLFPLENINELSKIIVIVDGKIKNKIEFNDTTIKTFVENNFFYWK